MDGTPAARPTNTQQAQLQALYEEMRPHGLFPLWEVLHALVTPTPRSPARAHLWPYAPARDLLLRAGDLISAEQAERRVLILQPVWKVAGRPTFEPAREIPGST